MEAFAANVERMMRRFYRSLRENDRRRYAAMEAAKLGYGGIEYIQHAGEVAQVFGGVIPIQHRR